MIAIGRPLLFLRLAVRNVLLNLCASFFFCAQSASGLTELKMLTSFLPYISILKSVYRCSILVTSVDSYDTLALMSRTIICRRKHWVGVAQFFNTSRKNAKIYI